MKSYTSSNVLSLNKIASIKTLKNSDLEKSDFHIIKDLLFHLPFRYEDRVNIRQISDLSHGNYATVEGTVLHCNIIFNPRRMMICQISDKSGILTIRFFNFSAAMKNSLFVGQRILVYGEVKFGNFGAEMIHPEYRVRKNFGTLAPKETLTPIYPAIKGVKQITLRKLINQALSLLNGSVIKELLPLKLAKKMMSFPEALRTLHHPPASLKTVTLENSQHPAKKRLILEELLAHNLSLLELRAKIQRFHAQPLSACDDLKNHLLLSLPFQLTSAQIRVVKEIERDMTLNIPMMRLVQGDVGSGKTLVAALAALRAISHGKQVAMMSPTELLAEQHVNNFRNWFTPLGIKVSCLSGKRKGRARLKQEEFIAQGKVKMIIGTHAIFQEKVQFDALALVIIDEQHRFGVRQRLVFWKKGVQKGFYPHQLSMTATPIPRTLAMSIYADLDTSTIDELPKGRSLITTVAISDTRRSEIIDRVRKACMQEKRQAYWVCTLIEPSDLFEAKAAKATLRELKLALPELKIGLLHGRMSNYEKKVTMQKFRKAELHLLVTTTLIEVGVDVPNSSLMIIDNPERLGLSQIHQLRGRIGRSSTASYCVLLYKSPLSKTAKTRLQVLRGNHDGFLIAQKDLEIRGPGELLGTKQTGNLEFKVANLLRDHEMIPKINRLAHYIFKRYPKQANALIERWMLRKNIVST